MLEAIGKILEYGILGVTTVLFLVLWLRERKDCKYHINKRVEMAEKTIPALTKASESIKHYGKELHEGLETVSSCVDELCEEVKKLVKQKE